MSKKIEKKTVSKKAVAKPIQEMIVDGKETKIKTTYANGEVMIRTL